MRLRRQRTMPMLYSLLFILLALGLFLPQHLTQASPVENDPEDPIFPGAPGFLGAGAPPAEVRFPIACYLAQSYWGKDKKTRDEKGVQRSLDYKGFLTLHEDYTLTYTPAGGVNSSTASLVSNFNTKKSLARAPSLPGRFGWGNYSTPEQSWNAFLIFLNDGFDTSRVSYAHRSIAVTYGALPDPSYRPDYSFTKENEKTGEITLHNPLSGMTVINWHELKTMLAAQPVSNIALSVPLEKNPYRYFLDDLEVPGQTPSSEPWPHVYYLFGDNVSLTREIAENPSIKQHYATGVTLPVYLGYVVVDKDFRFSFVNKCGWDWGAEALVNKINSYGEYMRLSPHDGPDLRWNYQGVILARRKIFDLPSVAMVRATFGIPPDDAYVPVFSDGYTASSNEMDNLKKLPCLLLQAKIRNSPAGIDTKLFPAVYYRSFL